MNKGSESPSPLPEPERRAYLEAMGIPVWVPRDAPSAEPSGAERPEAVVAGSSAPGMDDGADAQDMDWDSLRAAVLGCTRCSLCETRTQAVYGVGNPKADLLIIGEAPGQEEDRRGEPFVGPAGRLLDRMLAAIGLDRGQVFITNVLKCRPPRNRDPQPEEALACTPWLQRQIELIDPRIVLAVGRVSAQQLLETDAPLGRLREHWHRLEPAGVPLLVTYHPAYLLRKPGDKRKAWADLRQVRDALG